MKKFAHLEGGIDTWDDSNNDYKLRIDAHKNGLDGYLSPSDHEPTDEEIDFLVELSEATILYNSAAISQLQGCGNSIASRLDMYSTLVCTSPTVKIGDVYGHLKIECSSTLEDEDDEGQYGNCLSCGIYWENYRRRKTQTNSRRNSSRRSTVLRTIRKIGTTNRGSV